MVLWKCPVALDLQQLNSSGVSGPLATEQETG